MNQTAKRILSFVLCLVMLVGLLPAFTIGTRAEETVVDSVEETTGAPTPEEETTEPVDDSGLSAQADEPQPESAVVEGATVYESKEVYVLVSSVSAAGDYLFVNTNTAATDAHMLTATSNGVTDTANVTVATAALENGSTVTYITDPAAAAIWTASSTNSGWRLRNTASTNRFLRYNNGLGTTGQQNSATAWTSGTNTLYYNSNTDRYVRYSNGWGTSNSSATVYIYQKQTVELPVVNDGTYSITGKNVEKTVVAGSAADLSSTLTFVPESGDATTTDVSADAVYTVYSDETGIISAINGNTLTFTGKAGEAVVKVSHTLTFGEQTYTVTNYITVTAKEPTYNVEITENDAVITETLTVKNVTAGTPRQLGVLVTYEDENGAQPLSPAAENIQWTSSDTTIASVNDDGLLTFTGKSGKFNVTVTFTHDGKEYTDIITVSASASQYFVPEDGTSDFPEYPNEGAVRIDKNAQAVGNFSETGVAKVELSMTGVPYSAGNEIDVVIMIDMSTSMTEDTNNVADRVTPARTSAVEALEAIVKNEDGTINNNRVAVYTFNGYDNSNPQNYANAVDEILELQSYQNPDNANDATELTNAKNDLSDWIQDDNTDSGTNYGAALEKCYSVLNAAREEYPERKQYVIFVTDGEPTTGFAYETSNGGVADDGYNSQYNNGAANKYYTYTEYYSKQMRAAGVEVYAVGIQLTNNNANTILKKIGGNSTGTAYANAATHGDYAQFIDADESAEKLVEIFENIVNATKEAATNVTVTDEIEDEYTLILEAPNETVSSGLPAGTELTIDVLQYTLDENKNRTGTPAVIESVSPADTDKVTLDADGNIVFIDADTFTYDAATHTIVWKADKLDTKELALSYYVYLNQSAGYEADEQVAAGTYPTNVEADIVYTNHLDHECQRYFPVPQLTWNGAQVSYTFYLVNAQGQPVNRAGRVIPFAEAVYVTEVFTESVTWDTDEDKKLDAEMIAADLLPDVYELYDANTAYTINVYEDEEGLDLGNHFIITAGNNTTKVFNTKAGTIYSAPGTYDKDDVFTGFDFANTTVAFAVVWQKALAPDTVVIDFGLDVVIDVTTNDALEAKVVGVRTAAPANVAPNSGNYNAAEAQEAQVKLNNIVVGTASVESLSSVRFSLDRDNGMQLSAPATFYYESEASYYDSRNTLTTVDLYSSVTVIPATTVYYEDDFLELTSYTVTRDDDGNVTATLDTTSAWTQSVTTDDTQAQDRPGESQITAAIDADNNYGFDKAYENLSTYSLGNSAHINVNANKRGEATFTFYGTGFDVVGLTSNATGTLIVQLYEGASATGNAQKSLVVDTYYGYARAPYVVTYRYNAYTKEWKVIDSERVDAMGTPVERPENPEHQQTYVTYEMGWDTSDNDPNAVYQVPVMKMSGLTYGQYTVKIIAAYNEIFDHTANEGSYDLYLDAIRIYDPTGNVNEDANNAYVADGEGWPQYMELRNNIISAAGVTIDDAGNVTFPEDTTMGAIFIDSNDENTSIVDYVSYGPNNELYLASGQSVAFQLDQTNAAIIADVQIGLKLGNGSSVSYEMYNAGEDGTRSNVKTGTLDTATDLYYSIKDLADGTIVITNNGSDGILSITNIKVTYTQDPNAGEQAMTTSMFMDEAGATAALMSLRRMPVVDEPEVTEPETEVTEPETEATEPETEVTEPETEATEPETEATEPETEATEPETEPENEIIDIAVGKVIRVIKKLIGWLFG